MRRTRVGTEAIRVALEREILQTLLVAAGYGWSDARLWPKRMSGYWRGASESDEWHYFVEKSSNTF